MSKILVINAPAHKTYQHLNPTETTAAEAEGRPPTTQPSVSHKQVSCGTLLLWAVRRFLQSKVCMVKYVWKNLVKHKVRAFSEGFVCC